MLTSEQKDQFIDDFMCCIVKLNDKVIDARNNGEDYECLRKDAQWAAHMFNVIDRYSPDGYPVYALGCDYSLSYAAPLSSVTPITLTSVTITESDGSSTVVPVGIVTANLEADLNDFLDDLNDNDEQIELTDITWYYAGTDPETGTLQVRRALKPLVSALFTDDNGDTFTIAFTQSNCQYRTTDETTDPCDIDTDVIISMVKRICHCCPDVTAAPPCVNAVTPWTEGGVPLVCPVVAVATWAEGPDNSVCNLPGGTTSAEFNILTCFDPEGFYYLELTILNYAQGTLQVYFDGDLIGSASANGTYKFYFAPSSANGTFLFTPVSFQGCFLYTPFYLDSGWVNTDSGWRINNATGCLVSYSGLTASPLLATYNTLAIGIEYTIVVTLSVTSGTLTMHAGGTDFVFTTSGTFTRVVTAATTDFYFLKGSDVDEVQVCSLIVCPAGSTLPTEQTYQVLAGNDSDEIIDGNGQPILIS